MITPILGLGVFLSYNLIYVHKILTDTLGFHDIHQTVLNNACKCLVESRSYIMHGWPISIDCEFLSYNLHLCAKCIHILVRDSVQLQSIGTSEFHHRSIN